MSSDQQHARLMDAIYRPQQAIYDATRKYYLFGRDRMIKELNAQNNNHVLEIGCGTGRNLIHAHGHYPYPQYYGMDISQVMLDTAHKQIAQRGLSESMKLARGDARDFDPMALFGRSTFDRIFFSYSLSMIPQWEIALQHALHLLSEQGSIHVVDFSTGKGLYQPFRWALRRWLRAFHVFPDARLGPVFHQMIEAEGFHAEQTDIMGGYAILLKAYKA